MAERARYDLLRPLAEPDPIYAFKHALVLETAYHSLLDKEGRQLHLRIAAVLEQDHASSLDEQAAILAHHHREGEDWPKTAETSGRADDEEVRRA